MIRKYAAAFIAFCSSLVRRKPKTVTPAPITNSDDELYYSIDLAVDLFPGKWKDAQRLAEAELPRTSGIGYWLCARRIFLELGGAYRCNRADASKCGDFENRHDFGRMPIRQRIDETAREFGRRPNPFQERTKDR
jgi:hypothetical protein